MVNVFQKVALYAIKKDENGKFHSCVCVCHTDVALCARMYLYLTPTLLLVFIWCFSRDHPERQTYGEHSIIAFGYSFLFGVICPEIEEITIPIRHGFQKNSI